MRKPIIAGNWKMFKTSSEAEDLVLALLPLIKQPVAEVVLCPPFTSLERVGALIQGHPVELGAQNVYWEKEGAFTGEVAPPMLKALGVRYVIVGHSERRQFFGETDETVNRRAQAALAYSLSPIVCVGETLEQREGGRTFDVIGAQLRGALKGFAEHDILRSVLAYEPVWAIGTGKVATTEQAQEVHAFIRGLVGEIFGPSVAEQIRIQYGGSVKPDNAAALLGQPDIDGALVGGASLNAQSFAGIVKAA